MFARRLQLCAAVALAAGFALPATASAAPLVDHDAGLWFDTYGDNTGIDTNGGQTTGVKLDPFGQLVTLAPGFDAGQLATSVVEPSSFSAWRTIDLSFTASATADLEVWVQDADTGTTTGPLPLGPPADPSFDASADLSGLGTSVQRVRVLVKLARTGALAPTLQDLRVTWQPESVLQIAKEANASACAADTVTAKLKVSVSYVEASNLVVWEALPTPSANPFGQAAPLTFVSATSGGLFNAGGPLQVGDVTVPAGAVYWVLGDRPSGQTFALSYTVRSQMGTFDQTVFSGAAHAQADNAAQVASATVGTTITSQPQPFLFRATTGTYRLFGKDHTEAGDVVGFTLSGGNYNVWPGTCGETYFQAVLVEDVSGLVDPAATDPAFSGGAAFDTPPGLHAITGGGVYTATATTVNGVAVPAHSIYWDLGHLAVGAKFNVGYAVDLKAGQPDGPLYDGQSLHTSATLASGHAPEQVVRPQEIVIGVPDDPSGAFAKGDKIRGVASVSAGNDNAFMTIGYGDTLPWLLRTANTGASALNDVLMVDKIPAGTRFVSAFLPTSAAGTVHYHTGGAANDDQTPPDLDAATGVLGAGWTTTPPADASTVTWVAFRVPTLASPYFPDGVTPSDVVAELTTQVLPPADGCPETTLTNRGLFFAYAYTPFGETTPEAIAGGPITTSEVEPVVVVPTVPSFASTHIVASPSTVVAGQSVTHTLSIPNARPTGGPVDQATQVEATIPMPTLQVNGASQPLSPTNVTAPGGQIDLTGLPGALVVRWPSIAPNQTRTVTFDLAVPKGVIDGTTFTTSATVVGHDDVCGVVTGSAARQVKVQATPYLAVTKQVDLSLAGPGQDINYTLGYRNSGNAPSTRTWIVDRVPSTVAFHSAEIPANGAQVWFSDDTPPFDAANPTTAGLPDALIPGFAFSDAVIQAHFVQGSVSNGRVVSPYGAATTWIAWLVDDPALTPPQLVTDQLQQVRFRVTTLEVAQGTVATNEAAILSKELLQSVGNQARTVISPEPSLVIAVDSPDVVGAGEPFQYVLTYVNDSSNPDTSVVISLTLPDGVFYAGTSTHTLNAAAQAEHGGNVPMTPTVSNGGQTLTWIVTDALGGPLGQLEGGAFVVDVAVEAGTPSGTFVTAVAQGNATNDVGAVEVYASTTTLVENPDLGLDLLVDDAAPRAGETVTFTVSLVNGGANRAQGVSLTAQLPAGLTYVPGTTQLATPGWGLVPASEPTVSGGTLTWSLAAGNALTRPPSAPGVFPGATGPVLLVLQATVGASVAPGTTLQTCATVAATTAEEGLLPNDDCVDVRTPLPDVYVTKAAPATAKPGDKIALTLTYGNHNNEHAAGVVLIDRLADGPVPAGDGAVDVRYVSHVVGAGEVAWFSSAPPTGALPAFDAADPAADGWSQSPGALGGPVTHVAFVVGALPAYAPPRTIVVEVELVDPATGLPPQPGSAFEGCATISATTQDDDPSNHEACATTQTPGIDLSLSALCEPPGAEPGLLPGQIWRVTLAYANTGTTTAYGVRLGAELPATAELVALEGDVVALVDAAGQQVGPVDVAGQRLQGVVPVTFDGDGWVLGALDEASPLYYRKIGLRSGDRGQLVLTLKVGEAVASGAQLVGAGAVATDYRFDWVPGDPVEELTANNQGSCGTTVWRADPFLVKHARVTGDAQASSVGAGERIDYRLEYGNAGQFVAAGTVIEDTLPVGTAYVVGSLTNVPEGATVEFAGAAGYGYQPVGASGTPDPEVKALRIVWQDALPAPANAIFTQDSALDFQAGVHDGTAASVAYDAAIATGAPSGALPTYTTEVIPGEGEGQILAWQKLVMQTVVPATADPMASGKFTVTVLDAATGEPIEGYVDLAPDKSGAIDLSDLDPQAVPAIRLRATFPAVGGLICQAELLQTPIAPKGLPMPLPALVQAVNGAGDLAGLTVLEGNVITPAVWTKSGDGWVTSVIETGYEQASANFINAEGTVLGYVLGGGPAVWHVWTPDAAAPGGWAAATLDFPGATSVNAQALLDGDIIIGTAYVGGDSATAWVPAADGSGEWTPTALDSGSGLNNKLLVGWNPQGDALVTEYTTWSDRTTWAFHRDGDQYTAHQVTGATNAIDISPARTVIANAGNAAPRAFKWDGQAYTELALEVPAGATFLSLQSISDTEVIVGTGSVGGANRSVLYLPQGDGWELVELDAPGPSFTIEHVDAQGLAYGYYYDVNWVPFSGVWMPDAGAPSGYTFVALPDSDALNYRMYDVVGGTSVVAGVTNGVNGNGLELWRADAASGTIAGPVVVADGARVQTTALRDGVAYGIVQTSVTESETYAWSLQADGSLTETAIPDLGDVYEFPVQPSFGTSSGVVVGTAQTLFSSEVGVVLTADPGAEGGWAMQILPSLGGDYLTPLHLTRSGLILAVGTDAVGSNEYGVLVPDATQPSGYRMVPLTANEEAFFAIDHLSESGILVGFGYDAVGQQQYHAWVPNAALTEWVRVPFPAGYGFMQLADSGAIWTKGLDGFAALLPHTGGMEVVYASDLMGEGANFYFSAQVGIAVVRRVLADGTAEQAVYYGNPSRDPSVAELQLPAPAGPTTKFVGANSHGALLGLTPVGGDQLEFGLWIPTDASLAEYTYVPVLTAPDGAVLVQHVGDSYTLAGFAEIDGVKVAVAWLPDDPKHPTSWIMSVVPLAPNSFGATVTAVGETGYLIGTANYKGYNQPTLWVPDASDPSGWASMPYPLSPNQLTGNAILAMASEEAGYHFAGCDVKPSARLDAWRVSYRTDRNPSVAFQAEVLDLCQATITNTADIVTTTPEVTSDNNVGAATLPVRTSDLSVAVTADKSIVAEGETVALTVTWANAGPSAARDARVALALPTGFQLASASPMPVTGTDGRLTWVLGDLPAAQGGQAQLTLVESGAAPDEPLAVVAEALTSSIDCKVGNDTVAQTLVKGAWPNLAVTLTGPATLRVGEAAEFTATLVNDGNAVAEDVVHELVLPAGFTLQALDPAADGQSGQTLTWNVGDLQPGAGGTVTFSLLATDCDAVGAKADILASATTSSTETNVVDNGAVKTAILLEPLGALSAQAFANRATAEAGDEVIYTMLVTNTGAASVAAATATAAIPAHATYVPGSASAGGVLGGGEVAWTLGTLEPGAVAALTWRVVATGEGDLQGLVGAAGEGACPVEAPLEGTQLTGPGVHLVKSAQVPSLCPSAGGAVTWTLTLANTAATAASDVVVTDQVPAGMAYVPGSVFGAGASAASAPSLVWNVGTLAPGAGLTLGYQATVAGGAGKVLTNQAQIAVGDAKWASSTAAVLNDCTRVLTLAKAWTAACVQPGELVTVTLQARNGGTSPLTGVSVTDQVPAGMAFVSASGEHVHDPESDAVTFTVPSLAGGQTATLTLTLQATAGAGEVTANRASATAKGLQPVVSNQVAGVALVCDDGNACTVDTCSPTLGCVFKPAQDGTACDDGDACTLADSCQAGACVGAEPVVCEALDQCHTAGVCDPATGVCSNPAVEDGVACDDGDLCTVGEACWAGECGQSEPVECVASDDCHEVVGCDAQTGECLEKARDDGASCDDGDLCTTVDACSSGVCVGQAPVECVAASACHVPGTCDPETGMCDDPAAPAGTACDDGDLCTTVDTCDGEGACVGVEPVVCEALDPCHLAGTCNPATGVCDNPVAPGDSPVALTLTDVGSLGGDDGAITAANDAGQFVGWATTAEGDEHAALWTEDGGLVDLHAELDLGDGDSRAIGVGEGGHVLLALAIEGGAKLLLRAPDGAATELWAVANLAPTVFGPNEGGLVAGAGIDGLFVGDVAGAQAIELPEGATAATLVGLNDQDQVAGSFSEDGSVQTFIWTVDGGVLFAPTQAGEDAEAVGLNGAGQVAGTWSDATTAKLFVWTPGGDFTLLEGPESPYALGIGEGGHVIGGYYDGVTGGGIVWAPGDAEVTDLGSLGGGELTPVAVNAQGHVVGYAETAWGAVHAFGWSASSGLEGLGALGGDLSRAFAINDAGHALGHSKDAAGNIRAFLWSAERGFEDLGSLGGNTSTPFGLTAAGQVYGRAGAKAGVTRGFVSSVPTSACIYCPEDTTPPTLVCPTLSGALECVAGGASATLPAPTTWDACGQPVEVGVGAPETYPVGATPVVFTATDSEGNATSCTTTVLVADTLPPTLTCPAPAMVEPDDACGGTAVDVFATADDLCDGTSVTLFSDAPALFPVGETTVTFTAVDAAGHLATCQTKVIVQAQPQLTLTCEPELALEAPADACGVVETLSAQLTDGCTGVMETFVETKAYPVGTSTVSFDAEGSDGATATCATQVVVADVTPPVAACNHEVSVSLTAAQPSRTFLATATDACTATVEVKDLSCTTVDANGDEVAVEDCASVDGAAVTLAPRGVEGATVRWTVVATDPSGNPHEAVCETTVTAEPEPAPLDDAIRAMGGGGCDAGGSSRPLAALLGALAALAFLALRRRARS